MNDKLYYSYGYCVDGDPNTYYTRDEIFEAVILDNDFYDYIDNNYSSSGVYSLFIKGKEYEIEDNYLNYIETLTDEAIQTDWTETDFTDEDRYND